MIQLCIGGIQSLAFYVKQVSFKESFTKLKEKVKGFKEYLCTLWLFTSTQRAPMKQRK